MSQYYPDKWLVVKITGYEDHPEPLYKVFACWYGGYAGSDSWKLNSGITKATLEGNVFSFEGASGSVYECHKDCYGANFYGMSVLQNMIDKASKNGLMIDIMPDTTDWLELNYD